MISYCMAIKDRANFLAHTLPLSLANMEPTDELEILDYGSTDKAGLREAMIGADGRVCLYRYETVYWRVAHAKNLACRSAANSIICNLDADNWVGPGFSKLLAGIVDDSHVARPAPRKDRRAGSDGRIAMTQSLFGTLGGYDERMERWGFDATDIKARAEKAGATLIDIDVDDFLDHDDKLRGMTTYNARFFKNNLMTGTINPNGIEWARGNAMRIL